MALTAAEEAQIRALLGYQTPLTSLANNEATITSKLGAAKVNLSQLPAASSANTTDLILVRQGTADKSITLGTALSTATAAQFTNDTSRATTAFVQQSGLHFQPAVGTVITANTTLAASLGGHWIEVQTAGITVTLPDVTTLTSGLVTYTIKAKVNFTLKASGSTQQVAYGMGSANTLSVLAGQTLTVVASGPSFGWYVVSDGFGSSSFSSLLNTTGYQKLPGGLIIQWIYAGTAGASGGYSDNIYPIAFPNASLITLAVHVGTDTSVNIIIDSTQPNTLTTLRLRSSWGAGTSVAANIIAIGY